MLIQARLATASHWLAVSAVIVLVQAVRRLAASPRSSVEGNKGVKARTRCSMEKPRALPSVNRPAAAPWFGRSNRRKRGLGVLCKLGEMEQRQEGASVLGVCAPGRPCAVIGQPRAGMVPSVSGGEARPLGSRKVEAWARQNLRARGASAVGVLCLRAWPWS